MNVTSPPLYPPGLAATGVTLVEASAVTTWLDSQLKPAATSSGLLIAGELRALRCARSQVAGQVILYSFHVGHGEDRKKPQATAPRPCIASEESRPLPITALLLLPLSPGTRRRTGSSAANISIKQLKDISNNLASQQV